MKMAPPVKIVGIEGHLPVAVLPASADIGFQSIYPVTLALHNYAKCRDRRTPSLDANRLTESLIRHGTCVGWCGCSNSNCNDHAGDAHCSKHDAPNTLDSLRRRPCRCVIRRDSRGNRCRDGDDASCLGKSSHESQEPSKEPSGNAMRHDDLQGFGLSRDTTQGAGRFTLVRATERAERPLGADERSPSATLLVARSPTATAMSPSRC